MNIFFDLETRSRVDLPRCGGPVYAADPSTSIMSAVFATPETWIVWCPTLREPVPVRQEDSRPVISVFGPELPREIEALLSFPWIAHNCIAFDSLVWEGQGLPKPSRWIDSFRVCVRRGLPLGLENAAKASLGPAFGKDEHGHKMMLQLSKPTKNGDFIPLNKRNLAPIVTYNIRDVALLERLWQKEERPVPRFEEEVEKLDARINWRGFRFDTELAKKLIDLETASKEKGAEDAGTTRDDLRSRAKFAAELSDLGLDLPDYKRQTLLDALDEFPEGHPARVKIESRINEVRISSSKLIRGLNMATGDVLRCQFQYHKAHTGRWGGRGIQTQNLAARIEMSSADILEAIEKLEDGDQALRFPAHEVCRSLLRPCIRAREGKTLGILDFASVESCGLHWSAGDYEFLRDFQLGVDPYRKHVSKTTGKPISEVTAEERKNAKPVVLGAGYQAGPMGIRVFYDSYGISTEGLDLNKVIDDWRNANPLIAGVWDGESMFEGHKIRRGGLWKDTEAAAKNAIRSPGVIFNVGGKFDWKLDGSHLLCRLPSGRILCYRNARLDDGRQIHYDRTLGSSVFRCASWGGRAVENIVQALCRDIQAQSMLRLEAAGFEVVQHVHDEAVFEMEDSESELLRAAEIMAQVPSWAKGFPVAVAGFRSERYLKDPPPGAKEIKVFGVDIP